MNVLGRGAKTVGITHGSHHDVHLLEAGPWVRGRLLLFDLGFFRATLFKAVEAHGGYFLCRLREKSNPVIESTNTYGYSHLIGRKLKDIIPQLRHTVFDFDGRLGYQLRKSPYTHHDVHFRVVCLYNRELDTWHSYVTNLPPSMLIPEDIGAVYAARWEVELFFRELKSHYRLDQLPTKNRHISECLIYAAFLTLVLARKLYQHLLSPRSQHRRRLPFDRWAALVAGISQELLQLILSRRDRRFREHKLARYLRREAVDPNATRMTLATRAEIGIFGPA
jgi:IS4 transposase